MEWYPLKLSFQVGIASAVLALLIGVAIASLLANVKFRGRELVDALVTAPLVLPPTVLGYYVLVALGRKSWIGQAYEYLTGSSIVFTVTGCVVAGTVGAIPLVVKGARAALTDVDSTLIQAARTLGASRFRAYMTIQLPLAARGIIAGVTLAFAKSLGDFGVTLMVAGDIPGETQTASLFIYDAIQANKEIEAAGMIAVLSAIALGSLYIVNHLSRDRRD